MDRPDCCTAMWGCIICNPPPAKEDLTCNTCDEKNSCLYAWDLYNTNGDCLAEK